MRWSGGHQISFTVISKGDGWEKKEEKTMKQEEIVWIKSTRTMHGYPQILILINTNSQNRIWEIIGCDHVLSLLI